MASTLASIDPGNFRYAHSWGEVSGRLSARGVQWLRLPVRDEVLEPGEVCSVPAMAVRLAEALRSYFTGIPTRFLDIPLDLAAGTAFQQAVWAGARGVGWGHVETYAGLARRIGHPKAVRAVGQALGANPVPILVPCHRILAANGRLGGFSAGLHWKKALLDLEGQAITR